ncbi:hypothetical protein [Defluviicoccus vanus]|uniref:Uncharacterized protein n=1 Tax=Defluviicoccus vanus TaxID=111831 RepID=A0A7H1N0B8_9PROT|nr:hypothetical protein [Defluviicoccus vanus]QNT69154.1 hypothetical protein HQ394_07085 [Defluviicoccus vanus]
MKARRLRRRTDLIQFTVDVFAARVEFLGEQTDGAGARITVLAVITELAVVANSDEQRD